MTDIRILVTGWRSWKWNNCGPIYDRLKAEAQGFDNITIVHGECPYGGADAIAKHWTHYYPGSRHEPHPAKWHVEGPNAGPLRNQRMVNLGADLILAFPGPESRGTLDCVNRARLVGIPAKIYPWPGNVEMPHWPTLGEAS